MTGRDITGIMGAITTVGVITVIVASPDFAGVVKTLGCVFVNSIRSMTGQPAVDCAKYGLVGGS
ncbi:MAG: hypothetical protein M3O70_09190 [Actinomycetota bacterium]|nr:hypothetical protein [Actinomycetota bacterium]